jgi:hypothetical protein
VDARLLVVAGAHQALAVVALVLQEVVLVPAERIS